MKTNNSLKRVLLVFCLLVIYNIPAGAQTVDILQDYLDKLASASNTRTASVVTEIDMSSFSGPRTTTLFIRNGLNVRFINGTLKRASSLRTDPLIKISDGSSLEISSTVTISGGKFVTKDIPLIEIADGSLIIDGGEISGNSDSTPYNYGPSVMITSQSGSSFVMKAGYVYGAIVNILEHNTNVIDIKGGKIYGSNYGTYRACVETNSSVILSGDACVDWVIFGESENNISLTSPIKRNLTITGPILSGYPFMVGYNGYVLTQEDADQLTYSYQGEYTVELKDNSMILIPATKRVIEYLDPGCLQYEISESNRSIIEELTISGNLNGTDINLIREMANMKLKKLDISMCNIVEGGQPLSIIVGGRSPAAQGSGLIPNAIQWPSTKNNVVCQGMFYGLSVIEDIVLPNSVTIIEDYAFGNCSSLQSITFGCAAREICSKYLFTDSKNLVSLEINNNSDISVKDGVLYSDKGKTVVAAVPSIQGSCTLLSTIENISAYAFFDCGGLTNISMPASVRVIGDYAFCRTELKIISLARELETIGEGAFFDCKKLESVTYPEKLTNIGVGAFARCNLQSIYLSPTKLSEISGNSSKLQFVPYHMSVFEGNNNVSVITLPKNMENIGRGAFSSSLLTDIYCYAINPPSICYNDITHSYVHKYSFEGVNVETCRVHVPTGCISAYKEASGWKEFFNYVEDLPITGPNMFDEVDDLQDYLNSFHELLDVLSGSTYTRQFLNTEWQSLYVPFSLNYSDWSNNFDVARLDKFSQYDEDDDGEADRQELEVVIMRSGSDVLNANTPYLIRAKKAGTYNFIVNPSKLVGEEINSVTHSADGSKVVITGNYANQSGLKSAGRYRLMGGSLSIPTKDEEVLPPYRWYATIENSDKAKVRITFVDNATGIEPIDVDTEEIIGERRVYDLSGRRINISKDTPISSLPKGVYIINNKKYIIK